VLATQRPSVDVITGLIKANVPTRMSFRLATKVDSRTIIDPTAPKACWARATCSTFPPGTSRVQRVHAPFVTEKEISAVTEFWKAQGEAEYVHGFLEGPKDDKGNDEGGSTANPARKTTTSSTTPSAWSSSSARPAPPAAAPPYASATAAPPTSST
jgi:S-DNA-T family DNA segregation ATPase FtsK/SpoIIIE